MNSVLLLSTMQTFVLQPGQWCRLVTLAELAKMLGGRGDQSKLDPDRQPICLLLGGGMAAGKSTVRKIIGQADFWTRVSATVFAWAQLPGQHCLAVFPCQVLPLLVRAANIPAVAHVSTWPVPACCCSLHKSLTLIKLALSGIKWA